MKLIIFGSTGTIGKHLVKQAIEMGHHVTAFTRTPSKFGTQHNLLTVTKGDVLDYQSVQDAIKGKDAVLCALGDGRKGSVRSEGTLNIIKAMGKLNIDRLICQTTLGCGDSWNNLNFFWKKIMFGWFLKEAFIDHEKQEKHLFESKLHWTIVRPSAFTNGELTKSFNTGFSSKNNSLTLKISRPDVAYFMLQQVTSSKYIRKIVGISY